MLVRLPLTSFDQMPDSFYEFVHVEFKMPSTTVSHTTLRSISVSNENPPEKYVRYIAKYEYKIDLNITYDDKQPQPEYIAAVAEANQQQQQQYQQGIVHKISNATFVNYKKTKFLLSTNKSGYNQINNEYANDTIDEEDIGVVNVMNEMSTSTSLSSIQTQTTRISSPDLHFPIPTVDMIDSDLSDDDNNDKIQSAFRSNKRTPDSTSQYLINERKEGLKPKG